MSLVDRIQSIENEMAKTQKNKATANHLGILKAKLAKLKRELLEGPKGSGGGGAGEGFDVRKTGDVRIGLVGFPSVGKSTLMNRLTDTFSEVASYEFTTLTCVPGVLYYKGAKIQLLDLPGIIEGAKDGKGRGRQVIAVAKTCDVILLVLDCLKPLTHKHKIEQELNGFGIRINKEPPKIIYRKKDKGGVSLTHGSFTPTHLDVDLVKNILAEYRVTNADVHLKEDYTVDDLIDVIEGNRLYIPCIYVLNKIDQITIEELDIINRMPNCVPICANHKWNLDGLLEGVWEKCNLIRIYTKPKGQIPDYNAPVVMKHGETTVEQFCNRIHKTLKLNFKIPTLKRKGLLNDVKGRSRVNRSNEKSMQTKGVAAKREPDVTSKQTRKPERPKEIDNQMGFLNVTKELVVAHREKKKRKRLGENGHELSDVSETEDIEDNEGHESTQGQHQYSSPPRRQTTSTNGTSDKVVANIVAASIQRKRALSSSLQPDNPGITVNTSNSPPPSTARRGDPGGAGGGRDDDLSLGTPPARRPKATAGLAAAQEPASLLPEQSPPTATDRISKRKKRQRIAAAMLLPGRAESAAQNGKPDTSADDDDDFVLSDRDQSTMNVVAQQLGHDVGQGTEDNRAGTGAGALAAKRELDAADGQFSAQAPDVDVLRRIVEETGKSFDAVYETHRACSGVLEFVLAALVLGGQDRLCRRFYWTKDDDDILRKAPLVAKGIEEANTKSDVLHLLLSCKSAEQCWRRIHFLNLNAQSYVDLLSPNDKRIS